jgi:sortase (surface protein transpeptidase)
VVQDTTPDQTDALTSADNSSQPVASETPQAEKQSSWRDKLWLHKWPLLAAIGGLIVVLIVGHLLWNEHLNRQAEQSWAALANDGQCWSAPPGDHNGCIGVLRAEKLGADLQLPVLSTEQTSENQLSEKQALTEGLLWYPGTTPPGQIGNFVVAGYSASHGSPFAHLKDLAVGDTVTVATAQATYTYTIKQSASDLVVDKSDSWILDPVPGATDLVPSQALITLTTTADRFYSPDRSVAIGVLTATEETS